MNELIITYGVALGVFITTWAVLWGVKKIALFQLTKLSEKTTNDLDDAFVGLIQTINWLVLGAASLAFAIRFTNAPGVVVQSVGALFLIAVVYQVSVGAAHIVDTILEKSQSKKNGKERKSAMNFLSGGIKWIIWFFGGLLVLSNLGVNITSLIAGLGIGGVAIAFALQNILGDLFSSFAIYFDKPFEVGDYVVIDTHRGTVEKIGLKTTRIRSIEGEEIVISNQDLTSARLQNYRKLTERRRVFTFGVLYETPLDAVEKIPSMVSKIIESLPNVRFDRAHLTSFGASSLDFEVVYFVTSSEYKFALDIQQDINFALMRVFEKEKIEFAYPTQTLYVKK